MSDEEGRREHVNTQNTQWRTQTEHTVENTNRTQWRTQTEHPEHIVENTEHSGEPRTAVENTGVAGGRVSVGYVQNLAYPGGFLQIANPSFNRGLYMEPVVTTSGFCVSFPWPLHGFPEGGAVRNT